MARAPSIRSILLADIQKEDGDERLARTLTQFMEPVTSALEAGLTLEENLVCQWHEATLVVPDWVAPTLGTGFAALSSSPPAYRSSGQYVELRGGLTVTGTAAGTIFTLPATYRPPSGTERRFPIVTSAGYAYAAVFGSNGHVDYAGPATSIAYLDGIRFQSGSFVAPTCFPYRFRTTTPSRPRAVLLAECRPSSGDLTVTHSGPVAWVYEQNGLSGGNYVKVCDIPGLLPGTTYVARFLVIWK